jgi:hypothetical protein
MKILKFQETFSLNDEESFQIQQIIYKQKKLLQHGSNIEAFNTEVIRFNTEERLQEHQDTIYLIQ